MLLSLVVVTLQLYRFACASTVLGPQSDLHLVNGNIAPDGFTRPAVLTGGTAASASFPGPLIKANKGDHFQINVIDSLTDHSMLKTTSVHWHGLFQKGTNWADGTSFVTQCPIASNHSFMHDFTVPDQAGTFWYHSHLSVQYCDGLRGPLVIYDPNDPHKSLYDVDDESTVITLADWYHTLAQDIITVGVPPSADATLINGKGRTPGDPTSALSVINVQKGKRYRFRLIAMSCDPNFDFSIDGHNLTVIEADGESTKPYTVNSINILAGQRYSFVLNANQPVANYWVRAKPDHANSTSFDNGLNSAILRYQGAPNTDPTTSIQSNVVALSETDLHPLENPAAPGLPFPGGADVVIPIVLSLDTGAGRFLMNNVTFEPPTVPVLLQILSGAQNAHDLLPSGSVYTLPRNKTIEVVFTSVEGNAPGGPHPMHLHGHSFSVVQSAGGPFNYKNPVRRDTTAAVEGKNTTIRFVTDNPGPWFLHCHIDFHLAFGMAVVFAEDTRDTAAADPVPADWKKLCPIYDALAPGDL